MGRSSRLLLTTLAVGALIVGVSHAGVPDPDLSTVPNVVVSPDASLDYAVTVVGVDGPIDSALVQIVVGTEADGLICWCVGQTHPTIEATTNASGIATFNIAAGGCVDSSLAVSPPVTEVFANGIKLAEPGIVSPDVVDDSGVPTQSGWNPGGTCKVGTGDAVAHTGPIVTAIVDFCTDINSSGGPINAVDAVILTPSIVNAAQCTQAP